MVYEFLISSEDRLQAEQSVVPINKLPRLPRVYDIHLYDNLM